MTISGPKISRQAGSRILVQTCLLLWLFPVIAGCSNGHSGTATSRARPTSADLGPGDFLAADFSVQEPEPYIVKTENTVEGTHCILHIEQGKTITQNQINYIVKEFDDIIYPGVTAAFGNEPIPGIDNNSKVHILLLDIRDGYNGISRPSYIAGYFDPGNELPAGEFPYSNEKELIYMDISPAVPASPRFFTTLAHEFQHMIHWEQKDHQYGISDETWLDEAMSEIASVYCGYGPSYSRVSAFQAAPSDSLTSWDSTVYDYAVAYMWAHYMKDRFETAAPNIFQNMLQNNATGIDAVSAAVAPATFTALFKDWSIANYSGNSLTWPDRPEWSYTSLDTRPGTYNGIKLPGLFPDTPARRNPASPLPALSLWSAAYYSYTPLTDGALTWTASDGSETASLADLTPSLRPNLVSGQTYTFTTTAYLIMSNAGNLDSPAGSLVTRSSVETAGAEAATPDREKTARTPAKTPKALLDQANADHRLRSAGSDGGPEPVCVHSFLAEKGKDLRARGMKPRF